MQKINLALVALTCLLVVACVKAEPKASTISKSEIAAEQLIDGNEALGRVAIYLEEIDLKTNVFTRSHRVCPPLIHKVDLTAPYKQTLNSGFKQGFPNAEFITAPLSIEEMNAKNIQIQIRLKKPTVSVSYIFDENFFEADFQGFATLKGTLVIANQSGAVRQRILNISNKEERLNTFLVDCDGAIAKVMEDAATKTIKQFVVKNISTSKDMIRMLNSQN